ncbi:hypothetical protein MAH1_36500 [Sessilibacter sp. MAH1]
MPSGSLYAEFIGLTKLNRSNMTDTLRTNSIGTERKSSIVGHDLRNWLWIQGLSRKLIAEVKKNLRFVQASIISQPYN